MNHLISHDEWEDKMVAWVAGELDTEEYALVNQHIQSCNLCSAEVKEYELLLDRLHTIERSIAAPTLSPVLIALKQEIGQHHQAEERHIAEAKDKIWEELYPQLRSQAERLARQLNISSWQEQEDVTWDIVQESIRKVLERIQKAERGESEPVQSLAKFLAIVARNYSRDLRRRERRVVHVPDDQLLADGENTSTESISEVATENVYCERLFHVVAHEIVSFPTKQRFALLSDLASRMAFGKKPSVLQAAFQAEGIQLEEYRQSHAESEQERSRHAALLALAYKRLKSSAVVKDYVEASQ